MPRPTALVTGASRGVGAAVARALSGTHDVLLGGRDADALAEVASRLPGSRPWPVELTDDEALADAVAGIDHLEVLVHSAGIAGVGTVAETPAARWREMYDVNVVAVAELTRLLLPALRTAHGHVVMINSGAGQSASSARGAYAASKFALRALADSLRAEEAGLRVTSVFPGRVATEMQRRLRADEGGQYEPESYLTVDGVAAVVLGAVRAPADAHVTEVTVRPPS